MALDKDLWPSQSLSFPSSQADTLQGRFTDTQRVWKGPGTHQ